MGKSSVGKPSPPSPQPPEEQLVESGLEFLQVGIYEVYHCLKNGSVGLLERCGEVCTEYIFPSDSKTQDVPRCALHVFALPYSSRHDKSVIFKC